MAQCLICCSSKQDLITVTDRGKKSLREFALLRKDDRVIEYLDNNTLCYVHEECRKWFNNRKRILSAKGPPENSKMFITETRTSSSFFSWQDYCFICGESINKNVHSYH